MFKTVHLTSLYLLQPPTIYLVSNERELPENERELPENHHSSNIFYNFHVINKVIISQHLTSTF
jgi:hypothetical protein